MRDAKERMPEKFIQQTPLDLGISVFENVLKV